MSIFGGNFTLWKSSADQKRERENYSRWAFPFGEKQQEGLKSLFAEVFLKQDSFTMFTFLTCKEMFEKAVSDYGSEEAALEALADSKRKVKLQLIKQIKNEEWHKYLALVIADKNIDEKCEYPSAEEILESAKKIGKI